VSAHVAALAIAVAVRLYDLADVNVAGAVAVLLLHGCALCSGKEIHVMLRGKSYGLAFSALAFRFLILWATLLSPPMFTAQTLSALFVSLILSTSTRIVVSY